MKKYLLLATTAMFMAGNAMAGNITGGGQSAIVNVNLNLVNADTIASVTDMNFGTLAVNGTLEDGDDLATISTAGVVTSDNEKIIASSATATSAGAITFTNSMHDVKVVCTHNTSIDMLNGGQCDIAGTSGFILSNLTMSTNGKTRSFGAKLYTYNHADLESKIGTGNLSYPGITVTIAY